MASINKPYDRSLKDAIGSGAKRSMASDLDELDMENSQLLMTKANTTHPTRMAHKAASGMTEEAKLLRSAGEQYEDKG